MIAKHARLVVGRLAESDLTNLAVWTAENFGTRQAEVYVDALLAAIDELVLDPFIARSKARDELAPGMRSLHMAKRGRRGRHLILYLVNERSITIVRILHDSMELARHMPQD